MVYLNFLKCLFIFEKEREREREREREGGREHGKERGRERGRERIPSRVSAVSAEPDKGLELRNHEIVTWDETKSWTLNHYDTQATLCDVF